jgi:hypothetical protein
VAARDYAGLTEVVALNNRGSPAALARALEKPSPKIRAGVNFGQGKRQSSDFGSVVKGLTTRRLSKSWPDCKSSVRRKVQAADLATATIRPSRTIIGNGPGPSRRALRERRPLQRAAKRKAHGFSAGLLARRQALLTSAIQTLTEFLLPAMSELQF